MKSGQCNSCKKTAPTRFFCFECSPFSVMCPTCFDEHLKQEETAHHRAWSIPEGWFHFLICFITCLSVLISIHFWCCTCLFNLYDSTNHSIITQHKHFDTEHKNTWHNNTQCDDIHNAYTRHNESQPNDSYLFPSLFFLIYFSSIF